jgi:hypothetical protein
MKGTKRDGEKVKAQSTAAVRATISFPPDVYESLKSVATGNKVSGVGGARRGGEVHRRAVALA